MSRNLRGWADEEWKGDTPDIKELFDPGDTPKCACCGSKNIDLEAYRVNDIYSNKMKALFNILKDEGKPPFRALCNICSDTITSTWDQSPSPSEIGYSTLYIMKTIAYAANEIIKEIRKLRESN